MKRAIGLLEYRGIAKGILAADAMVKSAEVDLLEATTVCPGKYLVLIAGDVGSVQSALQAGCSIGEEVLIDQFMLANVHDSVFPALRATSGVVPEGAFGIIETFTAASAIIAGDIAAKSAQVSLVEIRLARGLGGKSFLTFAGDVGSVTVAVEAVRKTLALESMLVDTAVIPAPHRDLWEKLV